MKFSRRGSYAGNIATRPSLKITKSFAYKGSTKLFSNRYYFAGGTPANSGAWSTLAGNVTDSERGLWDSGVTIVEATGYAAGSDVPVFTESLSLAGNGTYSGTIDYMPGDSAMLVKYTTDARSTKNHPIYLFNYYHGVIHVHGQAPNQVHSDQRAALSSYAAGWISGFSDGTNTYNRCGPRGAVALTRVIPTPLLATHRDFPS